MRLRAPRRMLTAAAGGALTVALFVTPVLADITFGPRAQATFGVDANGDPVDGARDSTYQQGYDKFREAGEGMRIFDDLDSSDVDITIEVHPEGDVGEGDAWGTARPADIDLTLTGFEARAVEIRIADDQFDSSKLADTIHHELRHAEEFMDGHFAGESENRAIDDHEDLQNNLFRSQVRGIDARARQARLEREAENPPRTTVVITPQDTPNYTRIMADAGAAADLSQTARRIGYALPHPDDINDYLDSIKAAQATFTGEEINIRFAVSATIEYSQLGVSTKYNESVFECGTRIDGRRVVCPTGVQDMPAGDVLALAMVLAADVPDANPNRHYIYAAVLDSDGDPANNWRFVPPFDWDLFQNTDRWYQLIWNPTQGVWRLEVTQIDPGGGRRVVASTARAVVEGDTIVFFISASEFAVAQPGYRLTAFGHDGFFSPNDRGADVSGADPTEPLLVPSTDRVVAPD